MSAILIFDLKKKNKQNKKQKQKNQLRFSEVNYLNYTKRPNFAYGNYIFPKTRENKNKSWTHSTPLKRMNNSAKEIYLSNHRRSLIIKLVKIIPHIST